MNWTLRRVVPADGNNWDRYYDDSHGAGVVYENVKSRKCFGYVNGLYFEVGWPDTSQQFNGDAGRPAGYRIRPEMDGHWYLYAYVYSGDGNSRSEWNVQVL